MTLHPHGEGGDGSGEKMKTIFDITGMTLHARPMWKNQYGRSMECERPE